MADNGWTQTRLRDVIGIKHGYAFEGQYFRDEPPGDVLLTPGNFAIGGGFKSDKLKYYVGPVPDEFVLTEGDLLISMTDLSKQADTLGYPALVPRSAGPRFLHNQRLGRVHIRSDPQLDKRFLYYVLCSDEYRHEVLASATGTTVKHTSPNRVMVYRFDCPPPNEQRAIAHVLGTLDDKIELNRRMNETLEAMARTLFKSLFVDASQTARHEGWEINSLGDLTELITKGTTPTQDDVAAAPVSDVQINYLRVNAIGEDGSILNDKLMKIPESVHGKLLKRSVLKPGDVLYTIAGTIGRMTIVEEELLPANCNQAVAIIRPKIGVPPGFLLLSMQQPTFQDELHSNIVHAVQANLSLGMISKAKIISPRRETLSRLFQPIDKILEKISANRSESRTLAVLRDLLLPKLMSGELRTDGLAGSPNAKQRRE